jgi:hypothetical protein
MPPLAPGVPETVSGSPADGCRREAARYAGDLGHRSGTGARLDARAPKLSLPPAVYVLGSWPNAFMGGRGAVIPARGLYRVPEVR